jgi:Ca2+-transporting ATPase
VGDWDRSQNFAVREFMADDSLTGLSVAQAEALLKTHGPNTLRTVRSRNLLTIALATLREPMFIFLLVAASLYSYGRRSRRGLFLLGGAAVSSR